MNFEFSVIKGNSIHNTIEDHYNELFEVIKQTYIDYSQEKAINPNSYFLRFPNRPNARIIALPAAIGEKISGIKWIASYPDNVKHGFPRASAVIILNDFETGYPIACLEGSIISSSRTAFSAVLASETFYSNRKSIEHLGIVGNGIIANHVYRCFKARGWQIKKVFLFDLDKNSSDQLATFINTDCEVEVLPSCEALIKQSDLIAFTTTAGKPYIQQMDWFTKNQFILNLSLRDLAPEILIQSNNIVDSVEHVLSAQTSPHLTYETYKTKSFIQGTIGEYLIKPFELDDQKPTIFSPMGMGVLDLAMAYFIYAHQQDAIVINDFFHDLKR